MKKTLNQNAAITSMDGPFEQGEVIGLVTVTRTDKLAITRHGSQSIGQCIDEMLQHGEITKLELNLDPDTF